MVRYRGSNVLCRRCRATGVQAAPNRSGYISGTWQPRTLPRPVGESEPQGEPMGVRAQEDGKSEGRSVPKGMTFGLNGSDTGLNVTRRESGQTSIWCFILEDLEHSDDEKRYYCLGNVAGGIMTVRFTYRKNKIRIIGAGYWRKGKNIYERENKIHR